MEIKIYESLPAEAKKIRTAVFIEEQKFKTEFDGVDGHAKHLIAFDGDAPVATCRFYIDGGEYIIGRLAVIKEYRGKDIGSLILKAAESQIIEEGGKQVLLHSQYAAKEFYEKNGYSACSKVDFDEDCPHIWMSKKLVL
ncbi:MAG: GNAT family N-acetyltransferase [Clostridiales bacterium]|nr:GNAT family N-acetyltransferase [Clostridiales bacterium]